MKLSLFVFLGAMTLGFSSVAQADLYVQWLSAHKQQDCFSTCQTNRVTNFPMPTGIDRKTKTSNPRDSLFFICTTHKPRGGEWRPGFNRTGNDSCVTTFDGKEYQGTEYYCLCTNNLRSKIFR